jgi:hypothetical protein
MKHKIISSTMDYQVFEIECILKDKEGNPICFLRKDNITITYKNLVLFQKKSRNQWLCVSSSQTQSYGGYQFKKRLKNKIKIKNMIIEDRPYFKHLLQTEENHPIPQREYEDPTEPDMNPEKQFPDKDIDYPRQDEILDDEPLREITEPSEKEFDSPQQLPNEEETFPGVFPKT